MAGKYAIETVFSLIDKITRPLSNVNNEAKIVNRTLKNMYAGAEQATDRFMGKVKSLGGKLAGALGLIGIINIDKVVGALTSGVTNAIAYQTAIAKVGVIADTARVPLQTMSKDILNLSTKMGIGAEEIADSVYNAISAGVDTSKAVSFAETASKAAIGGFTDTTTAIDGLTSVLNAYGLQAERAMSISDQMIIAQKLGKTTFGDMAKTMGQVIPTAAALNVKTEELFSSVAALTANAIQTPQAMTGLKAALSNIQKPSTGALKIIKALNKQGANIDFSAAGLQSKGLAQFLQDIKNATRGDQAILAQLFGSTEALNAVNVLIGSGEELFNKSLREMQNSVGTTEAAFEQMMNTPEKRFEKVKNTIRNAGISLGTALLPAIEKIVEKIGGIADNIAKIDFSKYTGEIEKVFGVIGFFIDAITGAVKIAWQFRGVIIAIVVIMGLYYAVSMAVVGVTKLFTIWESAKKAVILATTLVTGGQAAAMALLKKGTLAYLVVDKLFTAATTIRNVALGFLTGGTLAQTAATAAQAVATGTATTAQWLLNAAMTANPIGLVIAAVAALIAVIVLLVKGIILLIKNWDSFVGAIKTGAPKVMTVLTAISIPFGLIVSIIREVIKNWDKLKSAFLDGGFINGLKMIGSVLLSAILAPVQGLLEILSYIPGLGHLAGKGADKIQEFRNFLTDSDNIAATKQNKLIQTVETEVEEPPTSEMDKLMAEYNVSMPAMPGMDSIDFSNSGISGEKNKLHGVVDISGGAAAIPSSGGAATGTATGGAAAASATPGANTAAILATVTGIAALIRNIDGNVSVITSRTAAAISAAAIPSSGGPVTRTAAGSPPLANNAPRIAGLPPPYSQAGHENAAGADSARNIAPVTQAERVAYSLIERRETVAIEVFAARGSEARIIRAPRDIEIELVNSGGNG